ncbi:hypothetical protein K458DRAFT_429583 [Lentithecium fluviatile CBS 122367]|uniref:Uncharacterized protein n=1 Tax=Lentithecium fluviatile CBS 122367 TaxID=1168545 RepID=A0A6G1J7V3_9PLEO|nr:hypothetical protein K458DRAFT_429583 [Lentithecium fluviatile CBS 122367]
MPQLHQLDVPFWPPELSSNYQQLVSEDELTDLMKHLHYVPNLRILHLYLPPAAPIHASRKSLEDLAIPEGNAAFRAQHLATTLFQYLEPMQYHCFIKGQQILRGISTAVAVQVSSAQLRDMAPDLDILDYDPSPQVPGQLPAHMHGMTPVYADAILL